jgi:2Fe-2S ferredoxin
MSKLFVIDLAGRETAIEARAKWTLMEIIRDADLPIKAECGGSCACATCHVYVDPDWLARLPPADGGERDTLDGGSEVEPNSRLACQIVMTAELDGLRVTLSRDATG